MSEDWDGQAGAKSGGRRYGEDIQGGGKPRPYISGSLDTDTRNVGAGLAPAPSNISRPRQSRLSAIP